MFKNSKNRSSVRNFLGRFRGVFKTNNSKEYHDLPNSENIESLQTDTIKFMNDKRNDYTEEIPKRNISTLGRNQSLRRPSESVQTPQLPNESLSVNCQINLQKESFNSHDNLISTNNNLVLPEVYANNSNPRGLAFIQNFEVFEDHSCQARHGSNIDYENLISLFTDMGYRCDENNGYCKSGKISADEFHLRLKEFISQIDHQNTDSCIVIIMSHGCGDKKFLSSDGIEIRVKDICQMLNNMQCKFLKDKPKILIFQFCRTSDYKSGVKAQFPENINFENEKDNKSYENILSQSISFASFRESLGSISHITDPSRVVSIISNSSSVFTDSGLESSGAVFENINYITQPETKSGIPSSSSAYDLDSRIIQPAGKLQMNADFFLVFSTVWGEVSYRDPKSGSILIKAICSIFKEYAHKDDIEELFRKVSIYMKDLAVSNETEAISAQTCERTNMGLDKKFYFNPMKSLNLQS